MSALTIVKRFDGFYDLHHNGFLVGRVFTERRGWTAVSVKKDGSRGSYAFSAPTRREAVELFTQWRSGSPQEGQQ